MASGLRGQNKLEINFVFIASNLWQNNDQVNEQQAGCHSDPRSSFENAGYVTEISNKQYAYSVAIFPTTF